MSSIAFSFTTVYYWCPQSQGHKHLHLPAGWCAGFCPTASSDVRADPACRQTAPLVHEDNRLHTYGSAYSPGFRWGNVPCFIHGHRWVGKNMYFIQNFLCVWFFYVLIFSLCLCFVVQMKAGYTKLSTLKGSFTLLKRFSCLRSRSLFSVCCCLWSR